MFVNIPVDYKTDQHIMKIKLNFIIEGWQWQADAAQPYLEFYLFFGHFSENYICLQSIA